MIQLAQGLEASIEGTNEPEITHAIANDLMGNRMANPREAVTRMLQEWRQGEAFARYDKDN